MKTILYTVEFTAELEDGADPNDVTFDIPVEHVTAQCVLSGRKVGTLKKYCMQEIWEEVEK